MLTEIFKGQKVSLVVLRKEQWDSDSYLEETTWSLYPWAVKLPRSPFIQVKWKTNKYAEAYNAPESTCSEVCNALHIKIHMQRYVRRTAVVVEKKWDSNWAI